MGRKGKHLSRVDVMKITLLNEKISVFKICEGTRLNFKVEGEHRDPLSEFHLIVTFSPCV